MVTFSRRPSSKEDTNMKKLLTMGILGVATIMGLSATALADDCVDGNGGATTTYVAPPPVVVQPVAYRPGWQARREEQRREEMRGAEFRRQGARGAELARLERLRQEREMRARMAMRHHRNFRRF